jgi:hypothetical protein
MSWFGSGKDKGGKSEHERMKDNIGKAEKISKDLQKQGVDTSKADKNISKAKENLSKKEH